MVVIDLLKGNDQFKTERDQYLTNDLQDDLREP
jgi:hypothetical protein